MLQIQKPVNWGVPQRVHSMVVHFVSYQWAPPLELGSQNSAASPGKSSCSWGLSRAVADRASFPVLGSSTLTSLLPLSPIQLVCYRLGCLWQPLPIQVLLKAHFRYTFSVYSSMEPYDIWVRPFAPGHVNQVLHAGWERCQFDRFCS